MSFGAVAKTEPTPYDRIQTRNAETSSGERRDMLLLVLVWGGLEGIGVLLVVWWLWLAVGVGGI